MGSVVPSGLDFFVARRAVEVASVARARGGRHTFLSVVAARARGARVVASAWWADRATVTIATGRSSPVVRSVRIVSAAVRVASASAGRWPTCVVAVPTSAVGRAAATATAAPAVARFRAERTVIGTRLTLIHSRSRVMWLAGRGKVNSNPSAVQILDRDIEDV